MVCRSCTVERRAVLAHYHPQMHGALNSDEETQVRNAPLRHMWFCTGRILFCKEDCLYGVVVTSRAAGCLGSMACHNTVKLRFNVNLAGVGRTAEGSIVYSGLKNKTSCKLTQVVRLCCMLEQISLKPPCRFTCSVSPKVEKSHS